MKFLLLFSMLAANSAYGQFENTDIGAKAVSLGGAFTSIADNSSAVFYNPAGINQMPYREISVFYSPSPFGISELKYGAVNYVEPTKFGTIALSGRLYGFDLYREITGTLSYANNYSKKIYYGANINYYNLKIQNYGSASAFGVDIGLLAYLTPYLRWGFSALNVNHAKIGQSKEQLPQVYRTGLSLQVRNDFNVIFDVEKDTRYKPSFKGGVEYSFMNMLDLRAGVTSEPSRFSAGLGFYYSIFQVDYAIYNHQDLGITHQASFTVNFGGRSSKRIIRESLSSVFETPVDTSVKKKTKKKLKEGEFININSANAEELMRLPYVSEKMANDIIRYRTEKGRFNSVEELLNIKGIKEKRLESIRKHVKLE